MSKVILESQKVFRVLWCGDFVNNIASSPLNCVNSGLFTKTASKPTLFSEPSLPNFACQSGCKGHYKRSNFYQTQFLVKLVFALRQSSQTYVTFWLKEMYLTAKHHQFLVFL